MTPRQRRKRRIVDHMLWKVSVRQALLRIQSTYMPFSKAMEMVYQSVRTDPKLQQMGNES